MAARLPRSGAGAVHRPRGDARSRLLGAGRVSRSRNRLARLALPHPRRAPSRPEIASSLVDEASLSRLGRWPLSRRLYAKAVEILDRAGARVIAFDLLFAETEEPAPQSLREAARAAAERLREPQDAALRSTLARIAEDEPDADFAGALRASGKVLLPVAFPSFDGGVEEAPLLAEHVYQRLDPSTNAPLFPLHPASTLLPISPLSEAAAGLGHVMVAFDRDGAPRYDYLAVPFDAEFVPSLAVRAAAAYLGLRWSEVGLALGDGIKLGDIFIPTDPAMRLVINYRGPRAHDRDLLVRDTGRRQARPGPVHGPDRADRRFVHRDFGHLSRSVRQHADPRHRASRHDCRNHSGA